MWTLQTSFWYIHKKYKRVCPKLFFFLHQKCCGEGFLCQQINFDLGLSVPGEFSHGSGMEKASREAYIIISLLEFVLLLRFELMNPNVLLDSTRNALVYFFQSLFLFFLLVCLFVCCWFVQITSLLSFYLCLIWQWVILMTFTAYGHFVFSTKCTSLFGQTSWNQTNIYIYFSWYWHQDPGINSNVYACWGSFPRAGFYFLKMLYISFRELPVDGG